MTLWVIVLSYAMIVIDISIAITALPKIQSEFHLSTAHLSWVQTSYTLVFGGILLLGARFGDVFGRRRIFIAGLSIFALASLVIGLSNSGEMLIASRAIQGLGAALLAPSTLSLLSVSFPGGHERTKAFGSYAAVAGAAATVGLVLGGIFAGYLTWRIGFFINPPIALGLILAARKYIPETGRASEKFDFPGAILSTIGMALIVFALVESTSNGSSVQWQIWLAPVGLIVLLTFFLHEGRARQPILPLRIFKSSERSSALAGRLFFLAAMAPFWFFTSQFLQLVMGFSPQVAGIAFLPTTLLNFATARFAPRLILRFGNVRVLLTGLSTCLLGLLWLSQVGVSSSYFISIALPMLLIGGGQGLVLAPLTTMGVAGAKEEDAGAASGALNTAHQLGGSIGLAVEIFISSLLVASDSKLSSRQILASRISESFSIGAALLAVAILIILMSNRISSVKPGL